MSSCATRLHGLAPPSSRNDMGGVARAWETDEAAAGIGLPGTTIANYQVVKQIGEGGMGRVFEVWHPQLHKSFALKLLVKQLEQDHGAIERFQSETLALGRVEHVNVVSAIDAGTWQGRPFLVTQLLQGTDLATHVGNHGPLGLEQTVPLTIQIARGIQAAHTVGLYHRDIKPSNLFLENNGTVKLLDFGLVRSETCESLTRTGCLMGSVDYLSPEQAQDPRSADSRSDIYSLGCTLIFLLSGSSPFPDDTYPSLPSKLLAHGHHSPPWLDRALASDSHPLLSLIQRMIAKQPAHRPQSAQEIIECLESLGSQRFECASTAATLRPSKKRFRFLPQAIGGVLISLLAAVTIFQWGQSPPALETSSKKTLTDLRSETTPRAADTPISPAEPKVNDLGPSLVDRASRKTLTAERTQSAHGPTFPEALMSSPRSTTRDHSQKFGSKPVPTTPLPPQKADEL